MKRSRRSSSLASEDSSAPRGAARAPGIRRYNPGMGAELFAEMKAYVALTDADAELLKAIHAPMKPHLPTVVDAFYDRLLQHPAAKGVLLEEPNRLSRLRVFLRDWLELLFCGNYDYAYYEHRCKIGRTHVRVDLPQHYMFTAMNVIRLALVETVSQLGLSKEMQTIAALHKLLDIELAIMNETYREDYVDRIQAIERVQFEQRISESEHLATIGQLAASLAHEIKNPLAGISGAIQVLGSELDDGHPHKEIIAEALRQIDRLDAAVRDLLLYARPQKPAFQRGDLSQIMAHALILLRQEPAFRSLRVRCDGITEQHWVHVDESQIKQVISNLMINAAHASEPNGNIRCTIESDRQMVRLVIEDDGCGMSAGTLARVFEPFYTTKARGTGLGLAICQRIVDGHNGRIGVQSEQGKGTRVTVELPRGA